MRNRGFRITMERSYFDIRSNFITLCTSILLFSVFMLGSIFLGFGNTENALKLIASGIVASLFIMMLRSPQLGIYVLGFLLPLNGIVIAALPELISDLWQPVLMLWFLFMVLINKKRRNTIFHRLRDEWVIIRLILFFITVAVFISCFSLIIGTNIKSVLYGLASYFLYVPLVIGILGLTKTEIRKALIALVIGTIVMCIMGIIEYYGNFVIIASSGYYPQIVEGLGMKRFTPSVGWNSLDGGALIAFVALYLLDSMLTKSYRAVKIFGFIVLIWSLFLTFSRGPWLVFLIAFTIWWFKRGRLSNYFKAGIVLIVLNLIVVILLLSPDLLGGFGMRLSQIGNFKMAIFPRFHTWILGFQYAYKTAFIGLGAGYFDLVIESQYIKAFFELGILGFLALLLLIFRVIVKGFKELNSEASLLFGFIALSLEFLIIPGLSSWILNFIFWMAISWFMVFAPPDKHSRKFITKERSPECN